MKKILFICLLSASISGLYSIEEKADIPPILIGGILIGA